MSESTAAIKLASTALSEIQKTIRFYRLYPKTHQFCVDSSAASLERLKAYIAEHGTLDLDIQGNGCFIGADCVLAISGQSTDLSSLLYPEGIFGIAFSDDLSEQEVSDFCETLAASYVEGAGEDDEGDEEDDDEEDLLSALWDHEFEGIEIKVQDPLAPAAAPRGDGPAARIATRIRSLVAEYRDEVEFNGVWEERAGDLNVEAFVQGLLGTQPPIAATDPNQAASFLLSGEGKARAALAAELKGASPSEPMRVVQIMGWATENRIIDGLKAEDLSRIRLNSVSIALSHGQIGDATTAASALAGDGRLSAALSKRLGSNKALAGVAAGLTSLDEQVDNDALIERGLAYLELLDPSVSVKPACVLYPRLTNGNVRRVFRRFLSANANEYGEVIEPLTRHEDEDLVKEAMGILAMGGKKGKSWELLKTLAKDEEHAYRAQLAQKVVGMVSGTQTNTKLLAIVLEDPDEERRITAAKKLSKVGVPDAAGFEKLVAHVKLKDFGSRGNSEINAVFNALNTLGGARSIVILQELGKKSFFSRGKATTRLRTLATNWLEAAQADRKRKKKYGR